MTMEPPKSVTELLAAAERGDAAAHERLWELVHGELHRIAGRQMAHEAPGHTLQTTALVNEAYIRLVGDEHVHWANRRHFFAAASKAMRRIRIDDARKRKCLKRGGSRRLGQLLEEPAVFDQDPNQVIAVEEALERLERADARKAEIVMLRYFAGLTIDETAKALDLAPRTVDSEWRFARAWLHRELANGDTSTS